MRAVVLVGLKGMGVEEMKKTGAGDERCKSVETLDTLKVGHPPLADDGTEAGGFAGWISLAGLSSDMDQLIQPRHDWLDTDAFDPPSPFGGWDWSELAEYLDIAEARDLEAAQYDDGVDYNAMESRVLARLRGHLVSCSVRLLAGGSDNCAVLEARLAATATRLFVLALVRASTKVCTMTALWEGLSRVRDDSALLSCSAALLEQMWT